MRAAAELGIRHGRQGARSASSSRRYPPKPAVPSPGATTSSAAIPAALLAVGAGLVAAAATGLGLAWRRRRSAELGRHPPG
jgi:hypothetical protein